MVNFTEYINSVRWKTAKDGSHQYTLMEWNPNLILTFREMVMTIREHGYSEQYFNREYVYLNIGEYKYWTMGAPLFETILINRCKISVYEKTNVR